MPPSRWCGCCLESTPRIPWGAASDPAELASLCAVSGGQKLVLLRETETSSGDLRASHAVTVGGAPSVSLLYPWLCGVGLTLPYCSQLLVLIFFFSNPSLSFSGSQFPHPCSGEGRGGGEWLLGLLGRTTEGGSSSERARAHASSTPHPCASATAPTPPSLGWGSSKPVPRYPLARKQASELSPGWKGMSNGANCRVGRRGWEEAAKREKSSCDAPITDQLGHNCGAAIPAAGGTRPPSR